MDTEEITMLAFLDAGQYAASCDMCERTAPYLCPRCQGDKLVANPFRTLDNPDDEIVCPECDGRGWVDEEIAQPIEVPVEEGVS